MPSVEPTKDTVVTPTPVSQSLPSLHPSPSHPQLDLVAPRTVITKATAPKTHRIAILDAGAQYGKVIDRRIRELSVQSDLLPLSTPPSLLSDYSALIISGGPQSVYGADAPAYDPGIFSLNIPILGICYGMQLINYHFGGKVEKLGVREDGQFDISIDNSSALYAGLPSTIEVLLTHGDSATSVPEGFSACGHSSSGLICSLHNAAKRVYGVQFHPEVDLTTHGREIFLNFIALSSIPRLFSLSSRLQSILTEVRQQVGSTKKVLMLLSGGVDSSVCAALLKQAVGAERIIAIHIDNGFMRLDESKKVALALEAIGLPLTVLSAGEEFSHAKTIVKGEETAELCATVNPEHKRKIIGDTFMRVSSAHISSLSLKPHETFLAQGTLRPDLIESASHLASSNAQVIKTHHNDTELVRELRKEGRIIEPLRDLHKDEVRMLGMELGLSRELVWRQPFPGPGLAIRVLCQKEEWRGECWEEVVDKVIEYGRGDISCSLLPCRTVGVQGDSRSYSSLVALSQDGSPSWPELFRLAKEIPKRVHGVNRVIYAFGGRLTSGWIGGVTPTLLTQPVIHQLQLCDDIVNETLLKFDLIRTLSQVPVILFPAQMGEGEGKRSICIRTFITNDFMTGVPAWPGKDLPMEAVELMVGRILKEVKGIGRVCFDLTSKPPATTEWE